MEFGCSLVFYVLFLPLKIIIIVYRWTYFKNPETKEPLYGLDFSSLLKVIQEYSQQFCFDLAK